MTTLKNYKQTAFLCREYVLAVFFDIDKTFDTTWKFAILQCHDWGHRGNLPNFLRSFLVERSFRKQLDQSVLHSLENGISPGSVLSATLFTAAVNCLVQVIDRPVKVSRMWMTLLYIYLE